MAAVRVFPCLCVDDLVRSIVFYRALLDLDVTVDVGWYAEIAGGGGAAATVAFVERGHSSVPPGFDVTRGGVLVSVVVDDATAANARAEALHTHFAQELRDEDFGQRHFMVVDPDGFLVDVIETITPSVAFRRELVVGRRPVAMNTSRLTIGEFSKLCRLTVVTLRHYDRVGLLTPAEIDSITGYRYYRYDQVDVALQIGLLRSLDVAIAELRPFVTGTTSLEELLAEQRARLTTQMHERQRMIDVIDALAVGGAAPYEIAHAIEPGGRAVGLELHATWARVERATRHGLARLTVLLRRLGIAPGATTGALFPIAPSDQVSVTVFVTADVAGAAAGHPTLVPVALGRVDAISTVHRGDHRLLGYAYHALLAQAAATGVEAVGPAREYYLPVNSDGAPCTRLVIPTRAHRRE